VAQLSQIGRAAGWISFSQKWKTIFCRHYRSIFNHFDVIALQSYRKTATLRFWATCTVHLRFIGKLVVDFLFILFELCIGERVFKVRGEASRSYVYKCVNAITA